MVAYRGWIRIWLCTFRIGLGWSHHCRSAWRRDYYIRSLIAQLCETFYRLGWAAGTGGGESIRIPSDDGTNWRVFSTPSGIQKEDLIGSDIFELDMNQNIVVPPKTPHLRPSACTPLWFIIYQHRPQAKCVIHTHSLNAVLVMLLALDAGVRSKFVSKVALIFKRQRQDM